MKIFIIGFMACGKTTTGMELSKHLDYSFIDLDKYIEDKTGMSIPVIFKQEGEEKFRKYEQQFLKEILDRDNCAIAAGGGTPCFFDNMSRMNKDGVTVYLKLKPLKLAERIKKEKFSRPLIAGIKDADLLTFVETKLAEREKCYNRAHHIIEAENLSVKQLVTLIDNCIYSR